MYLGVFAIGADLASGFLAYYIAKESGMAAMPIFKSMKAIYHRRAEADVYFRCEEGEAIKEMIETSRDSGERQNRVVMVHAFCEDEEVASFEMEVSVKITR